LKDPVLWKLSSLQTILEPVISLSGIDSGHGVTITPERMRRLAALISERLTGFSAIVLQGIALRATESGLDPKC
jgi:hypothetical protein